MSPIWPRHLLIFGCSLLAFFSGCANDALLKKSSEATTQCLSKYPAVKGHMIERQVCLNDASQILLSTYGGAMNILAADCGSNLLKLAKAVDDGAMAMSDYELQRSDLKMRCNAASKVAQQQDNMADAQLQALRSQVMLNSAASSTMIMNSMKPTQIPNLNCTSRAIGNQVNTNCY